jgi:hypothetical protein
VQDIGSFSQSDSTGKRLEGTFRVVVQRVEIGMYFQSDSTGKRLLVTYLEEEIVREDC